MAERTNKKRKRVKRTSGRGPVTNSPRYTPPVPESYKRSSRLVPIFMFGFFGLGVAIIILNYLPGAPLIPGEGGNQYLLYGLVLICLGFIAATRYK